MSDRLRILIVDDELLIGEELRDILESLGHTVTNHAFNAKEAISSLVLNEPDIAILDIQMQGRNQGFEIAEYIDANVGIPYIFLTSFADSTTVKQAASMNPAAYLLKPFNERDIFATLEIASKNRSKKPHYFAVQVGNTQIKLEVDSIKWIKSTGKNLEISTDRGIISVRSSLSNFLEQNVAKNILRVHRSYAINSNRVEVISSTRVQIDGTSIPVSRKCKEFLDALNPLNKRL